MKIRIKKSDDFSKIVDAEKGGFDIFPSVDDISFLEEEKNKVEHVQVQKTKKRKNKRRKVREKEEEEHNTDVFTLEEEIRKKYNSLKLKKIFVTTFIIILSISLLVFGTYNTFFKKEKSTEQLATEINRVNNTTPFPTEGIYGFLNTNINDLFVKNITYLKDTTDYEIESGSLSITKVARKTASIANVYFSAKIVTNLGENYHNFFIPIYYDWETRSYHPAGPLTLSINNIGNDVKIVKNNMLSFDDYPEASEEDRNLVNIFLTNFFILVYNTPGANYSQFYSGDQALGDDSLSFERISKLELYAKDNLNGYNCRVEYVVTMSEGLKYNIVSYLKIEKITNSVNPTKSSWLIKAIL